MGLHRYTRRTFGRELALLLVAAIWWIPFYFLVIVSLKPDLEALQSPLSFPNEVDLGNFSTAWDDAALGRSLLNSLIITGGSVLALIALGAVCAYTIARRAEPDRDGALRAVRARDHPAVPARTRPDVLRPPASALVGSYLGIILLYTGIWMPFSVFLYTGFVRAPEGVRGGIDRRRRLHAAHVQEGRVPRSCADHRDRRDLHRPDHLERLLPLADLPQRDEQDAAARRGTFVGAFASRWNLIFAAVIVLARPGPHLLPRRPAPADP